MENAIEVRGLCKDYGTFQLQDVSFTLPRGSIMGLIGENGAGKSTTIKAILNLIHRDGGEISVLGMDCIHHEQEIKEHVGVVLDESTFHDMLTAHDVEKILSKIYRSWDSRLFRQYLDRFFLPENKTVKTYSKGMKMKLSIAAALSVQPELLILDEATSGLDPVVRNEILDEFLDFIQDERKAVLISSHITSDLEKVADYVTYLHRGRVVLSESRDELLESYGRVACPLDDLKKIDRKYLVGCRKNRFGCEALVNNRREIQFLLPGLTVDPVTLEDIMVYTVKGDEE